MVGTVSTAAPCARTDRRVVFPLVFGMMWHGCVVVLYGGVVGDKMRGKRVLEMIMRNKLVADYCDNCMITPWLGSEIE